MRNIHCLNVISKYGTDLLTQEYELVQDMGQAEGVLVRSAAMHDMEFGDSLLAIAEPASTISPWSAAPSRESWYLTRQEPMPTA